MAMIFRWLSVVALLVASATPVAAEENWKGVPTVIGEPYTLVGNEFLRVMCNDGFPQTPCAPGSPIVARDVAISQFARSATVDRLATLTDDLSRAGRQTRRESRQGTAAALAMGSPALPSAPGRTSYNMNISTFHGEQAFGGSVMYRFNSDFPIAAGAGFSIAGDRTASGRISLAGEF